MTYGPGDTISVAADTLNMPEPRAEFSIGRIIPVASPEKELNITPGPASVPGPDYISVIRRMEGQPRPPQIINTDISFILLSLSLLIFTFLAVFGRRSFTNSFSSLSFRKPGETTLPGTSEVFSWPPSSGTCLLSLSSACLLQSPSSPPELQARGSPAVLRD